MIAYVPVIWNHDPKGPEISEFYYLSSYNINTTMRGQSETLTTKHNPNKKCRKMLI